MFDTSQATIQFLSIHGVDHTISNGLRLTERPILLAASSLRELLLIHVSLPFKDKAEYYSFTFANGDPNLNPMKILMDQFWQENLDFHQMTRSVTSHLYQSGRHPNVKSGDVMIMSLTDIQYEDELISCLVILKAESKDAFLQIEQQESSYHVAHDYGIALGKLDKAAIIYNVAKSEGYKIAIIDRANGLQEAQYWRDQFLGLRPLDDAYHFTQRYLNLAQTYIQHKLEEEYQVDKADQVHLIRRTADYFKKEPSFDEQRYTSEVLQDEKVIQSFKQYKQQFAEELNLGIPEQFAISKSAVKKSAKDFKSVLKLDKNFHIYIHGDRELIQRGTDEDGRKYYKLYFDLES